MRLALNAAAITAFIAMARDGRVNLTGPFAFTFEDGQRLLGASRNIDAYGLAHLAIDEDAPEGSTARFKLPVAKGGSLYRSALRMVVNRLGQPEHEAIRDQANALLDLLSDDAPAAAQTGEVIQLRTGPRRLVPNASLRMVRAAAKKEAEIYIYGPIGNSWWDDSGISANQFRKELKALGDVDKITVRINSEGGDVFDGKAIYTLLVEHKAEIVVHVDGLAASAASFIAMAGSKIRIAEGAFIMIHKAWTYAMGNADDLTKKISLLNAIDETMVSTYAARSGQAAADIKTWMAEETWFDGNEAVAKGFADEVIANQAVAARLTARGPGGTFTKAPAALLRQAGTPGAPPAA